MLRQKPIQHERFEQASLFLWATYSQTKHPELKAMYAIPNGGSRNVREAVNLQRSGVKAGIPDICLPVARHGYSALYIEMKTKGRKMTNRQDVMSEILQECGNKVIVCYSAEEAKNEIEEYLKIRI